VLPSYIDALTDRWQPIVPAGDPPTVMQSNLGKHCSASDCAMHEMGRWLQQLGEVGRAVVP